MASKRTARRGQAQSDAEIAELDSRAEEEVVPYDETLLDRARTQWQFGDWLSLARMNSDNFQYHPQRAKLALLAASGLFQQGDKNAAYRYIRLAQDWGCSRKLIVQMLASGTHNALACAAACFDQLPRAAAHLRSAVEIGGVPGDAELLTEARATRQFARAKSTNSKV
ncbi:MAG: hypothetical protein U1E96_10720 [Azonexus sp.]